MKTCIVEDDGTVIREITNGEGVVDVVDLVRVLPKGTRCPLVTDVHTYVDNGHDASLTQYYVQLTHDEFIALRLHVKAESGI